jgi:hypothetical protein
MKKSLNTIILFASFAFFFACTTSEINTPLEVENQNLEYNTGKSTNGISKCPDCLELEFSLEQTFGIKLCSYDFNVSLVNNPIDCGFSPGANTIFTPVSVTWDFGDGTGFTGTGFDALSVTHPYGGNCPDEGTIVTVDMVFDIFDQFASGGPDLGECSRTITHIFEFKK